MSRPTPNRGRLQAIQHLNDSIASAQPSLDKAAAERDVAKQRFQEMQTMLDTVDSQIRNIAKEVHRTDLGIYLNGASLERGNVVLGNEQLSFSGWRGGTRIPLYAIKEIELGTSTLAPRSGVPVFEKIWPGTPRPGETLILYIQEDERNEQAAVVADLRDAASWREAIRQRQRSLGDVAARRERLVALSEKAAAAVAEAKSALGEAKNRLATEQRRIAQLRSERERLKTQQRQDEINQELALKMEREAVAREILAREYKGAKDLQREANKLANDGWEIQNQSQGNKGKIVVTYIRRRK